MKLQFRIRTAAVVAACALVPFTGCSSSSKTPVITSDACVQASHDIETTRVAQGKNLTVQLPTTTNTAYGWRLVPDSADANHLQLNSRQSQWTPEGGLAFGVDPATDVFTFKARKAGTVTLEFIYDAPPGVPQTVQARRTVEVEIFDPRLESTTFASVDTNSESH